MESFFNNVEKSEDLQVDAEESRLTKKIKKQYNIYINCTKNN